MAKLKPQAAANTPAPAAPPAPPVAPAPVQATNAAPAPEPAPTVPTPAPAPFPTTPVPASVSAPGAPVPSAVAAPGQTVSGAGKAAGMIEKRAAKIKAATEGKTFTFKETREGTQFTCICGAVGKNAIVSVDQNGTEVLTGETCLKYLFAADGTNIAVPKAVRGPRVIGTALPGAGVTKQDKFDTYMSQFTPPFRFVRTQNGAFQCFCGGRGTNQIVVADANGTEFSVGTKCAEAIPGVELPKAQRKAGSPPAVSGLKGSVTPPQVPPSFSSVG